MKCFIRDLVRYDDSAKRSRLRWYVSQPHGRYRSRRHLLGDLAWQGISQMYNHAPRSCSCMLFCSLVLSNMVATMVDVSIWQRALGCSSFAISWCENALISWCCMVHTDKEDVECGLCETSWSREDDIQEEFITERWSCEANFCTSCVVCEDNLYFSGLYQSQVGCNAVTASQGRLWHHLANQRISPPLRSNLPVLLILHQVLLTRKRLTE